MPRCCQLIKVTRRETTFLFLPEQYWHGSIIFHVGSTGTALLNIASLSTIYSQYGVVFYFFEGFHTQMFRDTGAIAVA